MMQIAIRQISTVTIFQQSSESCQIIVFVHNETMLPVCIDPSDYDKGQSIFTN